MTLRLATGGRILCGMTVLALPCLAASAQGRPPRRLPPAAQVDCGDTGVRGSGFTVYVCGSGAGGTRYAHGPELLVVRSDGRYTGYRDAFSQADLVRRLPSGEVIAAHNNAIVQVTASALRTLVSARRLSQVPDVAHMAAIDAVTVNRSGDVLFRANYYARGRHGCENVRWELSAPRRLKLIARSRPGLICG